jgi:hypothetical protein
VLDKSAASLETPVKSHFALPRHGAAPGSTPTHQAIRGSVLPSDGGGARHVIG